MRGVPRSLFVLSIVLAASAVGCGGDLNGGEIPSYALAGRVVDFQTGDPVPTLVRVSVEGLTPAPPVNVSGADFRINDIPAFSVFHVLAGSPPDYRDTYNLASEVQDQDVTDAVVFSLREAFITELAEAFAVTPPEGTSLLIAQARDAAGEPLAGVPAEAFEINNVAPVAGPFFLDADLAADPAATETSASGWVVFFAIEPGLVTVNAAAASGYTMVMSTSPAAEATATLASIDVTEGEEAGEPPTDVSLEDDLMPLFVRRGCETCHSGGGIGRDEGGLTLDGSPKTVFRELTNERSPNYDIIRVDVASPDDSVLLRLPSLENPPDDHPNVVFATPNDPDYQLIRAWIAEGARNN